MKLAIGIRKSSPRNCQGEIRTPDQPRKLFGTALLLQVIDRELRIFLCLQRSFDHSRLLQRFDLFAYDKLKILSKPFCRVRVTTSMLHILAWRSTAEPM
jgi:hypothetical protein